MKHFLTIGLLFVCTGMLSAQSTLQYNDPDARFKQARELFQKEQYSLAWPVFRSMYNNGIPQSTMPITTAEEVKYYYIISGLKLQDATAEPLAKDFLVQERNLPRKEMVAYELGEYYYRNKQYAEALESYEKAGIGNLTNRQIADMKFHQGYAYFAQLQFDKAKPLLNTVRQLPKDPNYPEANYYYAFIAFSEKDYDAALQGFRVAEKSAPYTTIVPFYIAEIYYFTGRRDEAIAYVDQSLRTGGQYYDNQLRQLIGHMYFEKRMYPQAQPYLEQYVQKQDKVRREDLYELAYCYYEAKSWSKAIEGLKQIGGKEDSLGQNSMYLLADAYLKTGDKSNARNAFLFCASNNSNPSQKEISLFSYAKLSYELGYMDVALKSFQDFLKQYPSSNFINEAKELEIAALAKTSNYKDALVRFEQLTNPGEDVRKLHPGILYGRAVELINDQRLTDAAPLLDKVLELPYNNQQLPFTLFWKGELAYRNGKTEEALEFFMRYLANPQISGEVNPVNAKYAVGYCLLKKESYKAAAGFFDQIAANLPYNATALEQDVYLRLADCYFMNKDYKRSAKMYDEILALNQKGADYALFQKAIIAGALNKPLEKLSLLQSVESRFPTSDLVPDAQLEVANTHLAEERFTEAINPLQKLLKNNKAATLRPQVYLKLGVAYFNLDKNDESLTQFQQLVKEYPNAQESDEAVEYIRNIFVEKQQPGDFVNFMRQNGKAVSFSEEDSLTYKSAMLRYEAKDFASAEGGFTDYLKRFPEGKYQIEAAYFAAEIAVFNKQPNNAYPFYQQVAAKAPNRYAERSALQAARIAYFDLKDFAAAEKYFAQLKAIATQQENKLEAMRGLLRCQYKAQQWNNASTNAAELLMEKGAATDDRMMANMVLAKNYQINSQPDQAANAYKAVVALGRSEYAAEASYRLAELLYQKGSYVEAEKAAFEVIKKNGSYVFWVTRSYILLGDVYFKQKDLFNAEATFKSVAENASIDELRQEATQKLGMVVDEKNRVNKVTQ